jgi:hypothetical protein
MAIQDDFTAVTPVKKRTTSKPRKLTTAARNETLSQLKDELAPEEKREKQKIAKIDSKSAQQRLLTALAERFPPDVIASLIEEAIDLSIAAGNWKGVLESAKLLLQYSLGRPKQVTQSTSLDINELLRQLQDAEQPRIIDVESLR